MHGSRVFRILIAVCTLVVGLVVTLGFQNTALAASPTPQPASTTYQLPGGKVWGNLQKLTSVADYKTSDTQFASDPTKVVDALQQPQYFRVIQESDGSESLNLQPTGHGHVLTAIHFAYNRSEHSSLVAIGVPTATFVQHQHVYANPKGPSSYQSASSTSSPTASELASGKSFGIFKSVQANSFQSSYTIDTVWTDPVFLPVTEVRTSMTCTVDGTWVDQCNGSDWRYWYTTTSWYEYSHSISTYIQNSNHGVTWTHDHFINSHFCGWFAQTDVYYHDNEVDILADGSQYANLSTSTTGACSGLLSYSDSVYS